MLNRELLAGSEPDFADLSQSICFTTSNAGTNVNFFANSGSELPPASDFVVYVNGAKTTQDYRAISFNANDAIIIQIQNKNSYYPVWQPGSNVSSSALDYVKSVTKALPKMCLKKGTPLIHYYSLFWHCKALSSIPATLLANNPKLKTFQDPFAYTALTTIPNNLLNYIPEVENLRGIFSACQNLSSISQNIFAKNTKVKNMYCAFYIDKNLKTATVKIVSPDITWADLFNHNGPNPCTVIVPAGSTTEATFRKASENSSNAGLTIQTY